MSLIRMEILQNIQSIENILKISLNINPKKMKKLIYIAFLVIFTMPVSAQELINLYKNGTVRLVPDNQYAQNNDWNKVFRSYYDTLYGRPMGNRMSLIVLPDGSVAVNHAYRNYYTIFSPGGKFEKELTIKKKNGGTVNNPKNIAGIVNGNTFFTGLDNMGNMICFDFNGNYLKTLKLNYMTRQMIGLPNDKIAVVGWVIWKTKFRDFVVILDYNTNEQKIIWDHFTDRVEEKNQHVPFNYSYKFKERGMIGFNTMPFTSDGGLDPPPKIAYVNNNLVIALPTTGEILVYDTQGNLVSKDKVDWAVNYISVKEQKEIQQKAIDKYKSIKNPQFADWVSPEENKQALEQIIKEMEEDLGNITEPIPIPVISTIIKDSDGNLLFFEIPKEENANKFNVWVYENNGKFVCQSSFVCDDYNLVINPSKMVFHDGYIYSLQVLKKANGVPLRLVRFSLKND